MGPSDEQEIEWLRLLRTGNQQAFQSLFETHYPYLVAVAARYVTDTSKARDLTQDCFVELWEKRTSLHIQLSLKPYLRRALVNKCLNYLKREKRIDFSEESELPATAEHTDAQLDLEASELSAHLNLAIANLPDRCRTVFTLSRLEGKSHKEIANFLDISTKTIENQMTKALRELREVVRKHTYLIVLLAWIGDVLASIVYSLTS